MQEDGENSEKIEEIQKRGTPGQDWRKLFMRKGFCAKKEPASTGLF